MAHIDHFIGGTGVGIVDVCVQAAELDDNGTSPADLLEIGWLLLTDPTRVETSRRVEQAGPNVYLIHALMVCASTSESAMQNMRLAMSRLAEGG